MPTSRVGALAAQNVLKSYNRINFYSGGETPSDEQVRTRGIGRTKVAPGGPWDHSSVLQDDEGSCRGGGRMAREGRIQVSRRRNDRKIFHNWSSPPEERQQIGKILIFFHILDPTLFPSFQSRSERCRGETDLKREVSSKAS